MKALIISLLLGCSTWSISAQNLREPVFDKDHTIDYMVVYDNSKQDIMEQSGGEEAYAHKVVESINLVLKNSNINYRFRLAGTYHMNATAPNIEQGLSMLEWDEGVQAKREELKADIVVLLTEPQGDSNSGLAIHQAKHPDAYSCVMSSMAVSAYTAAHEAGHILGAYHSRSEYDHSPSTHPWAAAYISPKGYRTVMNTMAPGTTVPIYSGPESIWEGEVMGDATHDNVRMLRTNFPKMVHYGDYLEDDRYYATKEDLVFDKKPHTDTVTIFSNSFFQVQTTAEWIKLTNPHKNWGNVELEIPFTIEPNYSNSDRVGYIEFSTCDHPENALKINITQTAADLNLNGNNGSYKAGQPEFVEKVDLIRDFKDTAWQTLYLPCSLQYEDWKNLFEVARLDSIYTNHEGNEKILAITPLTEGKTEPNTPYMIRALEPGKKVLHLNYVNLSPSTDCTHTMTSQSLQFNFTGTTKGLLGQDMYNGGFYRMTEGALSFSEDVNAKLEAFRWYLSITNDKGEVLTDLKRIKVINTQNTPTGIETPNNLLPSSFDIYTIDGRLLRKGAHTTEDLHPGLYLINGKKVLK